MVLTRQRCPRISISMRHFIAEIGVEESLTRSCWCGGYRCPSARTKVLSQQAGIRSSPGFLAWKTVWLASAGFIWNVTASFSQHRADARTASSRRRKECPNVSANNRVRAFLPGILVAFPSRHSRRGDTHCASNAIDLAARRPGRHGLGPRNDRHY